jgi:2-keto-3-deoxy-6-phosphogluconate aldolase
VSEDGGAAVFVLADDDVAETIRQAVVDAGVSGVEVGTFPVETERVIKELLKLD